MLAVNRLETSKIKFKCYDGFEVRVIFKVMLKVKLKVDFDLKDSSSLRCSDP